MSELVKIVEGSGLDPKRATALIERLSPLVDQAGVLTRESASVTVTDATQVTEMKNARRLRLALREVRVESEKVRKDLKADVLAAGRAIDAVGKWIASKVESEEARLLECETFAERAERARKDKLRADRVSALAPFGIDCSTIAVEDMSDGAFAQLLDGSKLAHENRIAQAKKELEERERAERARIEEEKRVREENERLRREAQEREAKIEQERRELHRKAAAERAELERKAAEERAARERAEKAARDAELKARKDREEAQAKEREKARQAEEDARAAAAAPDAEKIRMLAKDIRAVMVPTCRTAQAKGIVSEIGAALVALADDADASADKLSKSRRIVGAKVPVPATPTGRNPAACENELATAIEGVAADDNDGSLQHTPTTWIGNEQFNRPAGGAA